MLVLNFSGGSMAIIVVSSEIEEIMGVCDSVVTISEGKKTAQLTINDQLTREQVLSCALGSKPDWAQSGKDGEAQ